VIQVEPATFYTPEAIAREGQRRVETPRGRLLVASCRSGDYLAEKVVDRYEQLLAENGAARDVLHLASIDYQFSDSETCVRLEQDVSGYDVYLFQALLDPAIDQSIDHNYLAFLIAARAFREWGANRITAVLPYLAYARQNKPTRFEREPTTTRLMADLSIIAGIDRLITWEPHYGSIHGFYGHVPVDELAAIVLLLQHYRDFEGRQDVIVVAPDAGASKTVTHFSRALNLNSAVASKFRPRQEEAVISEVIGDFTGKRTAILLDDMISSGGTVEAVIKKLVAEKGIEAVYLGVSHNLGSDIARRRLGELHDQYGLKEVVVTNSIPQQGAFTSLPYVKVRDLSDIFSRVINRIHYNRPVGELFYHGAAKSTK
jgi:ribose-phosphate pyrophosphokinase